MDSSKVFQQMLILNQSELAGNFVIFSLTIAGDFAFCHYPYACSCIFGSLFVIAMVVLIVLRAKGIL